jgi:hypothetical protein
LWRYAVVTEEGVFKKSKSEEDIVTGAKIGGEGGENSRRLEEGKK